MDMIAHQRALADRIITTLQHQLVIPTLLAGGAPRDWYFGEVAEDLDFYIHVEHVPRREEIAKALDIEVKELGDTDYKDLGKGDQCVHSVWEADYLGQKIQFIAVIIAPVEYVKQVFNCSLSQCWYEAGEVVTTWQFRLSIDNDAIVYDPQVRDGYQYKMAQKKHLQYFICYYGWEDFLGGNANNATRPAPAIDNPRGIDWGIPIDWQIGDMAVFDDL